MSLTPHSDFEMKVRLNSLQNVINAMDYELTSLMIYRNAKRYARHPTYADIVEYIDQFFKEVCITHEVAPDWRPTGMRCGIPEREANKCGELMLRKMCLEKRCDGCIYCPDFGKPKIRQQ